VAAARGLAADLDAALDEVVRGQLLVVEPDGSLSLRHALLAEALYADLLPGERRQLHGALADTLERLDARPGTLAEHADRAGDARRALAWSMRAADAAEGVHAYDEAHRQLERVRRLWPMVPGAAELVGADAIDVFSRAAAMAAICDHDTTAVEIIERLRLLVQDDPQVGQVRLGLLEAAYARALLDAGRTDAALVAARRAVELVPADPPTPARAVVVSGLVHVLDWAGGGPDWEPLADEAVDVARATGDGAAVARALVIRTTVKPAAPGTLADAREAVRLALADGTPELVGQTYSNLVDCLQCAGEAAAGIEAAREGVAAVTERGLGIRYGSWLRAQGGELCISCGRWDEAAELLHDALRDTRHVHGTNRDYALVNRARLSAVRGDFERLDADLGDLTRLPAVLELLRCEAGAEGRLWRGDASGALSCVVDVLDGTTPRLLTMGAPLAWLGVRALADLIEARRVDGRDTSGHGIGRDQTADVVAGFVERTCGPDALPGSRPRELRALCQAELSRCAEPSGGGPGPWEDAVSALDGAGRPYLTAYARWRLGHALLAARDHGAATEALRRAHAEACRLRATPLLGQIEALARRTRVDLRAPLDVPAAAPAGVHPRVASLTAREREILGHLAAGRTNGEIARALVISTKTASVHVSNILRKLDVATRYEAAELAERIDQH
jgi:DNA-binding CsgD family transcriptional regulator/tetratricopeptide (TPR) repeat protein